MKTWGAIAVVLGLCAGMVEAQESEWTAYASGVPWADQFDSKGMLLNSIYVPGFSDATAELIETTSLMISPSQRYIIYAASTGPASHMDSLDHDYQESIVIYEPATQEVVFKVDLPTYSFSGLYGIDEEAGQLAALVAHTSLRSKEDGIRYFDLINFEVIVFDYLSGSTTPIASLSDEPFLTDRFATTGELHTFKDGQVTFSLEDAQGDFPMYETHVWDINTNTLSEDPRYSYASDVLPTTGEAVRSAASNEYPFSENAGGPFIYLQSNVVQVWDPTDQAWHVFYHDPLRSFFRPRFIQNGERILVGATDADENRSWLLLERDGTLVNEISVKSDIALALHDLTMTPDGFLLGLSNCSDCSSTNMFEYTTRDEIHLSDRRRVIRLDSSSIIWLQPAQPPANEYMDWTFLTPSQP